MIVIIPFLIKWNLGYYQRWLFPHVYFCPRLASEHGLVGGGYFLDHGWKGGGREGVVSCRRIGDVYQHHLYDQEGCRRAIRGGGV